MFEVFARKSSGPGASSSSRPARSRARPTAPSWRPTAAPRCCAAVVFEKKPKPGLDFFPLTVNYQEKAFAAGKIPGGFFKREGRPDREGNADLAPDRSSDPPAVPRELSQRDAGRRHRRWRTTGERSRHRGDDRHVGRAHDLRHAVHGPDRRRARRLHRRQVRRQPDHRRSSRRARSTSSSPAPRKAC